ncbi:hypothetical protein M8J77_002156 [Diaphorina citri]|nr:hypothetical protein M8J77_002156 [Diaphorina citri]
MERRKPTKSKKSFKNMTKEQLQEALQKKKEGNAKALQIVESFIDNVPTEDEFLSKLFDINQSHYQDVVEERAILSKCGYVLCGHSLGNIPKKQYHISTLHNRVFDITERKNFCSNNCFKCSNYIKDQMLTSPLWMRDTERVPDFKLLHQAASGRGRDITGDEIDLGHVRVKPSEIEKPSQTKDQMTLNEIMADIDSIINVTKLIQNNSNSDAKKKQDPTVSPKTNKKDSHTELNESVKINDQDKKTKENSNHPVNVNPNQNSVADSSTTKVDTEIDGSPQSVDQRTNIENEITRPSNKTPQTEKKNNLVKEIIENEISTSNVKDSVQGNKRQDQGSVDQSTNSIQNEIPSACDKTPQTGKENNIIKEIIENKVPTLHDRPTESVQDNKRQSKFKQSRARENTKKKDEKADRDKKLNKILSLESNLKEWMSVDTLILLLGESAVQNVLLETNKHYKEHAEVMKKVNATSETHMNQLLGKNKGAYDKYMQLCKKLNMLEIVDEQEDSELTGQDLRPQKPVPDYEQLKSQTEEMMIKVNEFYRGDKRKVTFAEESQEEKEGDEIPTPVIPAVDMHAQNALRRKILLDKLNKILPEILRLLGAAHLSLSSDLRTLVRTFNLTAHNVMFQASEWSLIAVILLKLLSYKDPYLKQLLITQQSIKHLTLICMSYGLDPGYLDRLQTWLLDPHHVIAATMTSPTF